MSIAVTDMPDDTNEEPLADRGNSASAPRVEAMLEALAASTVALAASALWRETIGDILAWLGRASEVSRVTLFEIHPGPAGVPVESCRFDWAEPGRAPISNDSRYSNLPITVPATGALDDWSSRRAAGEIVAALRRETTDETRRIFEEHGTLSFLSVPLHVDGAWWGFLGFDDCRFERPWASLEIGLLRAAASVIAGAIQRERMEQRLRQSEERYSLAARGANDGLFDFDLAAGTAFCTERVREILCAELDVGCGPSALADFFVPEDARSFATRLAGVFRDRIEQFDFEGRLRGASAICSTGSCCAASFSMARRGSRSAWSVRCATSPRAGSPNPIWRMRAASSPKRSRRSRTGSWCSMPKTGSRSTTRIISKAFRRGPNRCGSA
ncbi:MAG: GAF domain-containing protein [Dongiaceae bacterium]